MIEVDEICVVRPSGGITFETIDEFRATISRIADRGKVRVVIDLVNVDMLTTPGISVMLEAAQKMKSAGGVVALARARPGIAGVLKRLRLGNVLEMGEGLEQAVQVLGKA